MGEPYQRSMSAHAASLSMVSAPSGICRLLVGDVVGLDDHGVHRIRSSSLIHSSTSFMSVLRAHCMNDCFISARRNGVRNSMRPEKDKCRLTTLSCTSPSATTKNAKSSLTWRRDNQHTPQP